MSGSLPKKGQDRHHIHDPREGFLHTEVVAKGYNHDKTQEQLLLTHRGTTQASGGQQSLVASTN